VKRATVLAATLLLVAACSPLPVVPPIRAEPPEVECVGIDDFEPNICEAMVALVASTFPAEVAAASRILVVDTCPPEVTCDRAFMHDAVVALLQDDEGPAEAFVFHVFGPMGGPLNLEPWGEPLPEHVAALINPGG
jgi:hypothetical protein